MPQSKKFSGIPETPGATAHELSQPLTVLLNKIQLLPMIKDDSEKMDRYLESIEKAAIRISEIVKKIQNIHSYDTKSYAGGTRIIDIDQN